MRKSLFSGTSTPSVAPSGQPALSQARDRQVDGDPASLSSTPVTTGHDSALAGGSAEGDVHPGGEADPAPVHGISCVKAAVGDVSSSVRYTFKNRIGKNGWVRVALMAMAFSVAYAAVLGFTVGIVMSAIKILAVPLSSGTGSCFGHGWNSTTILHCLVSAASEPFHR